MIFLAELAFKSDRLLGDIMQIRRGASPRPIQEYITKQDDGIPWIKIGEGCGVINKSYRRAA